MRTFVNHTSCACKYKEDILNAGQRSQPATTTTRRPSRRSQRDGVTRMQSRFFERPTTTMPPFSHFQRDGVTRVYGSQFESASTTVPPPFRHPQRNSATRAHDSGACPGGFVENNGHSYRCKWNCSPKYDELTCQSRRNGAEQFYIQERK